MGWSPASSGWGLFEISSVNDSVLKELREVRGVTPPGECGRTKRRLPGSYISVRLDQFLFRTRTEAAFSVSLCLSLSPSLCAHATGEVDVTDLSCADLLLVLSHRLPSWLPPMVGYLRSFLIS